MEGVFLCVLAALMSLQLTCGLEVELKVEPDSEEDEATFFSFECSVSDNDDGLEISSILLFRRTADGAELIPIAGISSSSPDEPVVKAGLQNIKAEGDIDADDDTYLKVLLGELTVNDLGLYVCEVLGREDEDEEYKVYTAEARLVAKTGTLKTSQKTSLPETSTYVATTTVLVEGTTTPLVKTTTPAAETTPPVVETTTTVSETTSPKTDTTTQVVTTTPALQVTTTTEEKTTSHETTSVPEETTVPEEVSSTPELTTLIEENTTVPPNAHIEEKLATLVSALQLLDKRVEAFNSVVLEIANQLQTLESNGDEEEDNKSSQSGEGEVIDNYFVYQNASYYFFRSNEATDVNRAQVACQSRKLYLTEVNDAGELQAIAQEISPRVIPEGLVLVAGQKQADKDIWLYQGSRQQVDFFSWAPGQPLTPSSENECLALRPSLGGVQMVSIPCTTDQTNFYFLCEHDD